MKQIGLITIGQAPRSDVAPIIEQYLKGQAELVQAGVLDGYTAEQVGKLFSPQAGEYVLTTRMADGSAAVISRERIVSVLQGKIDAMEGAGITTILLACTGVFPGLHAARAHLIEPDRIIPPVVRAMLGGRRLGLIGPLPEQEESMRVKFAASGGSIPFAAASPYTGTEKDFRAAAERLRGEADVIVLDCMGYVEQHRQWAASAGVPAVLSNALMGKLIAEMV
ncbi:AroM protein [Paenibacillus sp. FSL R7-0273]|uniref:AroM family protein n=1 Tax=Paenibacillus sp. FSL R7-0273 TaxID=1536772 RepID=UPI0004F79816|nr:AroM family protein [Paenibacillus sp. FSL R7-0273]AIQ48284.1 AroM protein [Paenibacillus sp. FSL R7-0273]OMF86936.1 AroM protein [Paenibacillus sp. FSL R7-0273]